MMRRNQWEIGIKERDFQSGWWPLLLCCSVLAVNCSPKSDNASPSATKAGRVQTSATQSSGKGNVLRVPLLGPVTQEDLEEAVRAHELNRVFITVSMPDETGSGMYNTRVSARHGDSVGFLTYLPDKDRTGDSWGAHRIDYEYTPDNSGEFPRFVELIVKTRLLEPPFEILRPPDEDTQVREGFGPPAKAFEGEKPVIYALQIEIGGYPDEDHWCDRMKSKWASSKELSQGLASVCPVTRDKRSVVVLREPNPSDPAHARFLEVMKFAYDKFVKYGLDHWTRLEEEQDNKTIRTQTR